MQKQNFNKKERNALMKQIFKRVTLGIALVFAVIILYLLLWPVKIDPAALTMGNVTSGRKSTGNLKYPITPRMAAGNINVEFRLVPIPHRIKRVVVASYNCSESNSKTFRIAGEVVQRED